MKLVNYSSYYALNYTTLKPFTFCYFCYPAEAYILRKVTDPTHRGNWTSPTQDVKFSNLNFAFRMF